MQQYSDNWLRDFLNDMYDKHCNPTFIESDPIQVPHAYATKEDIEIAAFLSSAIAWGKRQMIIRSAKKLVGLMGESPYEFILNFEDVDLERFAYFKHRTFQPIDCMFFMKSLQNIYRNHGGLQQVFSSEEDGTAKAAIANFRNVFFSIETPERTHKHISDVTKNSAAKRINLFLMWMVRSANRGVHFGLWDNIKPAQLMIPLDVHVATVSRKLGLLTRKQNDWKAVDELTTNLRKYDADDPVKYDFSLFSAGVLEKL